MTLKINLLPQAERKSDGTYQRIFLGLFSVWLLVLLAIYGYDLYRIDVMEDRLARAEQQYQLLRTSELVMSTAKQKWALVQTRNQTLLGITKERDSWQAVLTHLGVITPVDTYLTDLSSTDNGLISLKGTAMDATQILTFVQRLEQDIIFSQPTIMNVSQGEGAESGAKFEITVKIKGLAQ